MVFFVVDRRLVQVACPSVQQESPADRVSFQTTVEGRVKALVSPRQVAARSWELEVGLATPQQQAVLDELAAGAWGDRLGFVPADGPVVNVLSPAASMLDPTVYPNITQSGPVVLGDGVVSARSLVDDAGELDVRLGTRDSPVQAGGPVSASAWVRGQGAYLLLQFLDVDGVVLRGNVSTYGSSDTTWERVFVSMTVPAEAVAVRLLVRSAIGVTMPAVTWTTQPQAFGHGRMCDHAVVHAPSTRVLRAVEQATYYRAAYTVQEVG
jgi:hypothetical protein